MSRSLRLGADRYRASARPTPVLRLEWRKGLGWAEGFMLVCGMFMGASALRMRPASWPLDVIVCAFLIWLASVNSWNTMVVECDGERLRAWLTPFSIPASFVGRPIDLSLSRIVHVGKHYSSPLHSVRVTDADGEHVSLPFGSRTARVPQFVADTLAEHIEALRPEADTASVASGASA